MNEKIYKSIKSLPLLDDTVIRIQQVCNDNKSTLMDLVAIIKRDPMLMANILHSANSPLYGFSREITDINRAVSLFGMATIRGFALYGAVKKSFNIDLSPYGLSGQDFLDIVTAQSILVFDWYNQVNREIIGVLAPTSFLMEIGKIIIAKEIIETGKTSKFKEKLREISTPEQLSDLETEIVGVSNEEVTAKILEQWNLEDDMSNAIFYSNSPETAPKHIKPYSIALKITKNAINIFGILSDENMQNAMNLLSSYGFEPDAFLQASKKVKG